ncbi:hypothetical protein OsI_21840 [Oryza sativa Indica Group]|uniref:Uncharacterized protein n=1 Tax=Oryza sativa subsp. indica TaxID=39946 RepID=B8B3I0_ORYSI|nr:hypothetical protein OsI_21840 [Oryza sativa Indica Group]
MAHRLLRDAQADGWERSDFPIICESCLGDNPYVRMLRAEYDKECKICARPFTVFRWRPGRDARYKKTEICQTCCKLKNVCQVCLLDLEYGLPVQVRDTALAINSNDAIPRSDVNREYFAEEHDRKAEAAAAEMAHRLLRDAQADGWERSDFPIICESCLGDNPYVRMLRAEYDKECKICARPFTVFRWRPGRDARYKKTEICQTCCKLKNVCQVCLLDLEYGLPVQVRDTALAINSNDAIPRSDVNREYFAEEHDRKARAGIDYDSSHGKAQPNDTILKLQRTAPYYKRNRAHVCSFYVRGECTRGAECPYRHEMPETGELSQQNIKDRYYGVNDPVALKLLGKAGEMPSLTPPDDESIRTLYIGGLNNRITEQDLRDQFYAHGEIESIRMVLQRACAFVTYTTREGAEKAAEELANKLVIKGIRLKLMWGKPQAPKPEEDEAGRQGHVAHGGMLPRAVISQQQSGDQPQPPGTEGQQQAPSGSYYFNIPAPPGAERTLYPSMIPRGWVPWSSHRRVMANPVHSRLPKLRHQAAQDRATLCHHHITMVSTHPTTHHMAVTCPRLACHTHHHHSIHLISQCWHHQHSRKLAHRNNQDHQCSSRLKLLLSSRLPRTERP